MISVALTQKIPGLDPFRIGLLFRRFEVTATSRFLNLIHVQSFPKAIEYQSTSLECAATGYPLPKIIWFSPGGQKIDRNFLSRAAKNESLKIYAETFSIDEKIVDGIVPSKSHLLSILNVANVNRKTAGQYTCKVANVLTIPCKLYKLHLLKYF